MHRPPPPLSRHPNPFPRETLKRRNGDPLSNVLFGRAGLEPLALGSVRWGRKEHVPLLLLLLLLLHPFNYGAQLCHQLARSAVGTVPPCSSSTTVLDGIKSHSLVAIRDLPLPPFSPISFTLLFLLPPIIIYVFIPPSFVLCSCIGAGTSF